MKLILMGGRAPLLLILLLLLVLPSAAQAQVSGEELPEGVTGDDVYRVASKLYCDVCAGVPLSACPSPTCVAWRQEIAELIGQGLNDDSIRRYFADRYGGDVTGVPLDTNQRNLALGLPAILTIILGIGVIYQVWRMRQQGETQAQVAARSAGIRTDYARPVPDNVDRDYLDRFLKLLEGRK